MWQPVERWDFAKAKYRDDIVDGQQTRGQMGIVLLLICICLFYHYFLSLKMWPLTKAWWWFLQLVFFCTLCRMFRLLPLCPKTSSREQLTTIVARLVPMFRSRCSFLMSLVGLILNLTLPALTIFPKLSNLVKIDFFLHALASLDCKLSVISQ